MNSLNTNDFLESYKNLHLAKYPSLDTNEWVVLASILAVCIEFEMDFNAIQSRLDQKTSENKTELENYLAEKSA